MQIYLNLASVVEAVVVVAVKVSQRAEVGFILLISS